MCAYLRLDARHGAAHDQTMPPYAPIPLWAYPLDLHILEAGCCKPLRAESNVNGLSQPRQCQPSAALSLTHAKQLRRAHIQILLLGGEQHPGVSEEAGQPEGRVHWTDHARQPALLYYSVCLPA